LNLCLAKEKYNENFENRYWVLLFDKGVIEECCYSVKFVRCLAVVVLKTNGEEQRRSLASLEMTINGGGHSPPLTPPKKF
jgi:hypothetical protein